LGRSISQCIEVLIYGGTLSFGASVAQSNTVSWIHHISTYSFLYDSFCSRVVLVLFHCAKCQLTKAAIVSGSANNPERRRHAASNIELDKPLNIWAADNSRPDEAAANVRYCPLTMEVNLSKLIR
jgi:hypothetical protein